MPSVMENETANVKGGTPKFTKDDLDIGVPLQVVSLDMGQNVVMSHDENLKIIEDNMLAARADKITIVSIMGAYRTGKSFMLDMLMRYLTHQEGMELRQFEIPEGFQIGGEDDGARPDWLEAGKEIIGGVGNAGDDKNGFRWRAGMDKCTEGIWIWSKPFMRTVRGKKVALLMMDTQGAWDSRMTKEQSATIFGLTAIFSSKLIYNLQSRIQEDHIDNLDYFTTFATTVLQSMQGHEDATMIFQQLEFLIRDWEHYEDGMDFVQCVDQAELHLKGHLDDNISHNPQRASCVERLQSIFDNIHVFALPHPGSRIPKTTWDGNIKDLQKDFCVLTDCYAKHLFQKGVVQPKHILGHDVSPHSFVETFRTFIKAFKDAKPDAVSLRGAFVACETFKAKDEIMQQFQDDLDDYFDTGVPVAPETFIAWVEDHIEAAMKQYDLCISPFGLDDVDERRDDLRHRLMDEAKKYEDINTARLGKSQVKAACFAGVGAVVGVPLVSFIASLKACFLGASAVVGGGGYVGYKAKQEGNCEDGVRIATEDIKRFSVARFRDVQEVAVASKACWADPPSMDRLKSVGMASGAAAQVAGNVVGKVTKQE